MNTTANARAIYILALDIPGGLKELLIEAARECYDAYHVSLTPNLPSYHVVVTAPFRLREDLLLAELVSELSSQSPVRMPTQLGEYAEPRPTLYFGGQDADTLLAISALQGICERFTEERTVAQRRVTFPHCLLTRDLRAEHRDLCRGIFQNVPFPDPLHLDTLLLYRLIPSGLDLAGEISLQAAA
ncbi:MAG: hypothetical protein JWN90_216 [Parcubacteria group bacterium]|nr:hypothetical protein [Parcubacteria group bacterium]